MCLKVKNSARPIRAEMSESIKSMKKGKSPGCNGLTVEFYIHFRNLIKNPYLRYLIHALISKNCQA